MILLDVPNAALKCVNKTCVASSFSNHVCVCLLPADEVNRGGPRAFHRQLLQSVQRSAHLRVPEGRPL